MNKSVFKFGVALAAVVAMSSAANAAVSFTSFGFNANPGPAAGQSIIADFDSALAPGYLFTSSAGDTHVFGASVGGVAAAPAGDSSNFFSVAGGGTATLTSNHSLGSLSILIGSVDTYNSITFNGIGGFTKTLTGADLYLPANGDQGDAKTNREFYFTFDGADKINQVVFQSSGNSFEFDNIAAGGVPEPRTWIMLILGFGLTGMMLRRRSATSQLAV